MPIIGFNIGKIDAEKKKAATGKIAINNTPKISKLEVIKLAGRSDVDKCIKVDYEFSTNYEPKIAHVKFTGELFYLDKDQEDVVKQWNKTKKLPDTMTLEILNFLFKKLITKSLIISEDMQLPPAIPLPRAQMQGAKKNPKYIE